jgi:alkanesulfonate monooxygenase SsuD/methylene tetrahydromethanopterin reductase-like flavin-dependent oxidoreductase (luciferase family)
VILSVLAFAAEDPLELRLFEARWDLSVINQPRGLTGPLSRQTVLEYARSGRFRRTLGYQAKMVTGSPEEVVGRLRELAAQLAVDELMLVAPPGVDPAVREWSLRALVEAWHLVGQPHKMA